MAGIRASRQNRITFPCQWHSGVEYDLHRLRDAPVYRCGGSMRLSELNAHFPFNYVPEPAREHQNCASVVV